MHRRGPGWLTRRGRFEPERGGKCTEVLGRLSGQSLVKCLVLLVGQRGLDDFAAELRHFGQDTLGVRVPRKDKQGGTAGLDRGGYLFHPLVVDAKVTQLPGQRSRRRSDSQT